MKKSCFLCFWYNYLDRFQNDRLHINIITRKWKYKFIISANCKSVVVILPSRPQPQLQTCSLLHCREGGKGYCVPSKIVSDIGKRKASTWTRKEFSLTCLAPKLWLKRCWARNWVSQFGALMLHCPVSGGNLIILWGLLEELLKQGFTCIAMWQGQAFVRTLQIIKASGSTYWIIRRFRLCV